jgi:hypothetical protein
MPPAFPRMSHEDAAERVRLISNLPLFDVSQSSTVDVSAATYYQTATFRIGSEELEAIQRAVRALAIEHGYPTKQARGRSLAFDQQLTVLLQSAFNILPADAADEGVWSFFTLNVCPEVALWRFPNDGNADGGIRENYERLIGKPRNVFRRAWWRGYILGPELSSRLLEDESVGIMERPSIGGNARLARSVAALHLEHVDRGGIRSRQDLLRDSIKRLRRRMGQISIHALDDSQLKDLVDATFEAARAHLSSISGKEASDLDEVDKFRELTGPLWLLLEPLVIEVDWIRMNELLAGVRIYGNSISGNEGFAAKLVSDLESLISGWDGYTPAARSVVHGAVSYFMDLNDDIPDDLPTGLDDDNEVIGAAFEALSLLRD